MKVTHALTAGLLFAAAVTAAIAADLPPLANTTPNGDHFPGKFVWAELYTPDPAAVQGFYTGLFGWEATPIERTGASGTHTFISLTRDGDPVAGIALRPAKMADAVHGRWVGYVSVPDVAKTLEAAKAAGGRVLFPAKDLARRGTQAVFVDPEGAELGLIHTSNGDPGDYEAIAGEFAWAQLFAKDPAAQGRFYSTIGGLEAIPDTRGNRTDLYVLASGGYSRAGVVPVPSRPKAKPAWLLFVRVDDVKASAALAVKLGGRVLVAPSAAPTEYWRAVVADPDGAALGIVQIGEPAPATGAMPASPSAAKEAP